MQSKAATAVEYLSELSEERRQIMSKVREVILKNLPDGYVETMNWGMISYEVPLSVYPDTYNKQPLSFAGLASQKNHCSLYLMCVYQDADQLSWMEAQFESAGKKLNMGKSCIRFKKLEDLQLDVIGKIIAETTVEKFIKSYEKSRVH